jgi:hypothetical protein
MTVSSPICFLILAALVSIAAGDSSSSSLTSGDYIVSEDMLDGDNHILIIRHGEKDFIHQMTDHDMSRK